ncbi:MAG: hypothetical protein J2P17_00085 [Mycobacterium sp.]|nr:hypothetical protein [Mycobacterium sp.]
MYNRIRLEPLDTSVPDREIFIGWDRGLGTFFAQVFEGTDPEGEDILLVDRGDKVDEITDPAEAIDALRPYAQIPDTLAEVLTAQRDAPGAREKSPFVDVSLPREPAARTSAAIESIDRSPVGTSASDLIEACGLDSSQSVEPPLELDSSAVSSDAAGPDAAEAGP